MNSLNGSLAIWNQKSLLNYIHQIKHGQQDGKGQIAPGKARTFLLGIDRSTTIKKGKN